MKLIDRIINHQWTVEQTFIAGSFAAFAGILFMLVVCLFI